LTFHIRWVMLVGVRFKKREQRAVGALRLGRRSTRLVQAAVLSKSWEVKGGQLCQIKADK